MTRRTTVSLLAFLALALSEATAVAQVAAPVLKWRDGGCSGGYCDTGWYASPAIADLDGNGTVEVVWSAYDVAVVNGADGSPVWSVPNGQDRNSSGGSVGRTWPGVVVGDIDGNGSLEVVTAHGDGWVSAYDASGYFRPGWPRQPTPGDELRSLAVKDIDADGDLEIGVGATRSEDQWFVLEHDGSVRPGWPQLPNGICCATGLYNQNIALGDVDGDGQSELIGPNDTHYIAAFRANGQSIAANAMFGAGKVWHDVGVWIPLAAELRGYGNCGPEDRPNWNAGGIVVVDVDGDGSNEIVGVGNVHDCSYSPYLNVYFEPYIWKGDRSRWSNGSRDWTTVPAAPPGSAPLTEDYDVIENVQPNTVAADLDGDGEMEILFPSFDGRVHCFRLDQSIPGNWPAEVYDPAEGFFRFASEVSVADLDADGSAEVLFGSWPQKSSQNVGYLHVVDANGNELHRTPVPAVSGDWNGILAAPSLGNIDADADLEAVVGTSATGIVAFDLPGTSNARVIWGTGRGSNLRSGGYANTPLDAEFTGAPLVGPAPLAVSFADASAGGATSWSWDFGDGGSSTSPFPTHTYTAPGLYTVTLSIGAGAASDSETKVNYVAVTTATPATVLAGAGPGGANPNVVKMFSPFGELLSQFTAYAAGAYGTNVRSGAITVPPLPDILTGPGPGAVFGPQVRAFDDDGAPRGKVNFFAYGTLKYGVNVASASIDGDAFHEIETGAGPGAIFGGIVRGFDYDGAQLTSMGKVNFAAHGGTFGVHVAMGDVDADGFSEFVLGPGPAPTSGAAVIGYDFDGAAVAPLFSATAFPTRYGSQVAAGDLTGDGSADAQVGVGWDPAGNALHAGYTWDGTTLSPLGFASWDGFAGLRFGLKVGDAAF